jgi:glycosyltransferase involved in cell wall biosynthesis
MSGVKISVLLLAQNSEKNLKRCLDSLVRFEEVVLVDGGSNDKTLEIAKEYKNVKVYVNRWPGFIEQRNFSIEKASYEWCFMIDSDEAATLELVDQIYKVANSNSDKVLYRIIRTEYYEGIEIKSQFGGPSLQERLFKKDRVKYCGGNHHSHLIDGILANEREELVGTIDEEFRILHDETYSYSDWVRKLPRFILLVGEEKVSVGRTTNPVIILLTLFFTFFQIYFKTWRDGKVGFFVAVQESAYRVLVRLFIYKEMHFNKPKEKELYKKYLS